MIIYTSIIKERLDAMKGVLFPYEVASGSAAQSDCASTGSNANHESRPARPIRSLPGMVSPVVVTFRHILQHIYCAIYFVSTLYLFIASIPDSTLPDKYLERLARICRSCRNLGSISYRLAPRLAVRL